MIAWPTTPLLVLKETYIHGKSIFKNKLLYLMNWKNICEKNSSISRQKENKNMIIYFLYLFPS